MSVIINEFEIITTPPPAPAGQTPAAPAPAEPAPPLRPHEVERIVRHQHERRQRVRAD